MALSDVGRPRLIVAGRYRARLVVRRPSDVAAAIISQAGPLAAQAQCFATVS